MQRARRKKPSFVQTCQIYFELFWSAPFACPPVHSAIQQQSHYNVGELKEKLEQALNCVERGLSVQDAAKLHGVHVAAIRRRRRGKMKKGSQGPKTSLTPTMEQGLVLYIQQMAESGFGLTLIEIRRTASMLANKRERNNFKASNGW